MSYAEISATHVDALLTAAVRWTAAGLTAGLEEPMRRLLDLSAEEAEHTGVALLVQNRNTALFGGDPDEMDEWEVDVCQADEPDWLAPTSHDFRELPGTPSPEGVIKLIADYYYQSSWEGTGLGKVAGFVAALERCARIQLGDLDTDEITSLPRYLATPWRPTEQDRDMFVRLG